MPSIVSVTSVRTNDSEGQSKRGGGSNSGEGYGNSSWSKGNKDAPEYHMSSRKPSLTRLLVDSTRSAEMEREQGLPSDAVGLKSRDSNQVPPTVRGNQSMGAESRRSSEVDELPLTARTTASESF